MERKGICGNVGVCTMAGKVQVVTDDDAEFVCCECGEELEPYKEEVITTTPPKKGKAIVAIAAAVAVLGGLGAGAYFLFGGKSVPTEINLDKAELNLTKYETAQITPTVEPEGATATFVFKKGTARCIEVGNDGVVTAVKGGEATITVTCEENPDIHATCRVTVTEPEIVDTGDDGDDGVQTGQTGTDNTTSQKSTEEKTEKPKPVQNGYVTNYNLGYGTYTGDLKNGKPHGHGTITYRTSRTITGSYEASPGDKYEGDFRDGRVSGGIGYWTHNGNMKTINP